MQYRVPILGRPVWKLKNSMRLKLVSAAVLMCGAAWLAGCSSASRALGVTKAPLVVPPDYSLRPPAPGEPRPQELEPESAARIALMGQREAEARSDGEKLLVTKAGGDKADPLVRYVVDDEFGAVAHKDKGFADWVMFWRKGKPAAEPTEGAVAANTSTPIDPATEATRIRGLTGDQPVVIARRGSTKIKLPGL